MTANKQLLDEAVLHTDYDPIARIDLLRRSGAILYEVIGGSFAYGTALPSSDKDLRGIFCLPSGDYLSTRQPIDEISDKRKIEGQKTKNDDQFYTLRRIFELLKVSGPNTIELLWLPDDCIISSSPEMKLIIENRHLFISKACIGSHFGYANAQIQKAKGKNKKVHNPCPRERPKKLDFCRLIPCIPSSQPWTHPDMPLSRQPFRPIPIKDMPWIDLKDYHVAAVEYMHNAYRLYCYYGDPSCKGVFRGDDMLVCESIPLDDEHTRFSGILLYSEQEYEVAIKAWKSYWDWVDNRNDSRWLDQENGLVNYDAKNMMHCIRLLISGLHIVKHGEPLVRFDGAMRQYLLDIRQGKPKYEDLMAEVERRVIEMEEAAKTSTIPYAVDEAAIEALYSKVATMACERLFGGVGYGK